MVVGTAAQQRNIQHVIQLTIGIAVVLNITAYVMAKTCPMQQQNTQQQEPPFTPHPRVFATVWPILYTLIAAGIAITANHFQTLSTPTSPPQHPTKRAWVIIVATLLMLQVALNLAWVPTYSCANKPHAALYILLAMLAIHITTIVAATAFSHTLATLIAPYAAWLGFAVLLNTHTIPQA